MKTYIFNVIIEKDFFEDGREAYHAYAPALKGAATWGYTKEEAINNIKGNCLANHKITQIFTKE